jgi:hypothetical protein
VPQLIRDELAFKTDICDKTRYVMRKNRDGLCGHYGCGVEIDLELPWKFCREHRRDHCDEQKKLNDSRVAEGLCTICSNPVSTRNKRLCERHRVADLERKRITNLRRYGL